MEWAALSAIAAVCIVIGGVLRHVLDFAFITGTKNSDLEGIRTLLLSQGAKIELIYTRFSDHEKEDARMFARLEALVSETAKQQVAVETRFTRAIEELANELRGINVRVDRLLERNDYRER